MPLQSQQSHGSRRALLAALVLALCAAFLPGLGGGRAAADTAASVTLCSGFDACTRAGMGHDGYKSAKSKMYWNMYSGVNCTNYVAYRLINAGMPAARPTQLKPGVGNATYWGGSFGSATNSTPTVGSVAWWKANTNGVGSAGHVALVEQVLASGDVVISESNYGSEFTWRQITKGSNRWPSGFIHLKDTVLTPTAAASVAGVPQVGVPLTAKVGAWSPAPAAYSYQWYASGVAIPGATGATFTPTVAQYQRALQIRVVASRAGYAAGSSFSAPATPVAAGTQVVTDAPSVVGTPQVDEVLTADPGSFSPAPEATNVQWLANGAPIAGATARTFVPTGAQANARISLQVTAVKNGYAPLVKTSAPTAPVLAPPLRTAAATVTGERVVGKRLSAAVDTTPAGAARTYVWLRDGKPMAGATASTYTLKTADVGRRISARITASAKGFLPATVTTAAVSGIKTPLAVRVTTAAKVRTKVVVRVSLTPPSGIKPPGKVWIKVGTEKRAAKLKNGVVKITFKRQSAGVKAISVYYKGNGRFLMTQAKSTVKVPATKAAAKARR